jgi:hypothetical protein
MQTPDTTQEFEDLGSHVQMWNAFTGFALRSIIVIIVLLLLVAWMTGIF